MDVQSRIKKGFRDMFGFVEAVLPTKSGLTFLARFINESSVMNALQTVGNFPVNNLTVSIKPAYKSKWINTGKWRQEPSWHQRFGSTNRPRQESVVGQPPLEPTRSFEQESFKPPPPFMPPNLPAIHPMDNRYMPRPGDPLVPGFFSAQAMAPKAAIPAAPVPGQMPGQGDSVVATRSPPKLLQGESSDIQQKTSNLRVEGSQTKPPAVEVLDDGNSLQGKSAVSVRVALPSDTNVPAPLSPSLDDQFPPENMARTKPNEGAAESEQRDSEPPSHGLDIPLSKMSIDSLIHPTRPGKEKSYGHREDQRSSKNWQLDSQGLDGANSSRIESEPSSQHARGGPDVTSVGDHQKEREQQPRRKKVSEPAESSHCRVPSIFTKEEIKDRKQAWDRIPMPLNPQKVKRRNLPTSSKPASSAPKVHAVEDKPQSPKGKTPTTGENQIPCPNSKSQPPPSQQTKTEQLAGPIEVQPASPRKKRMGKEKQNPQTLTIRENQPGGVENEIASFFGLRPGQKVTIEAHQYRSEQINSPDVSSNPLAKENESGQAAPVNETPPIEQSQSKNKRKKKNKKTKRNQSVSSLARPQVTNSHWEPQKGPETETSTPAGRSSLESEGSSSKMHTPPSEASSGLNPLAADFVSPPAEKPSSDEDSDMSLMFGVFGQLAQNKREQEASRKSSSETIDFEPEKYRRHTCEKESDCQSSSDSPPHVIFTKGKQPEIKPGKGKGKKPMRPVLDSEEAGPSMEKKEGPKADPPSDPSDPGGHGDQPGLVNDSWPTLPPRELLTQDMLLNDAPAAWSKRY
ncbi:unnamed protein product [Clonostachys rosea]|uniref:RRM domain-containing protein n=1 Tax=Bionectria ochroleuca TaxID=29856 RepID=A0ABY6TNL1_BIOOC|nr:unnamed protein product [Clonostachys rosea]